MDDWITTVTCEDCGKKMAKGAYPEHDCVTRESAADTIERLQRALAEAERERDEARAENERLRAELSVARKILREAHTELTRVQLFAATRQKMHPCGLELLGELCEQIERAALAGEG